jgi:hypothetical protein
VRTAVAHAVPRVWAEVYLASPSTQQDAVAALLGKANIHNYMTPAYTVGEGASGPPPEKEPV